MLVCMHGRMLLMLVVLAVLILVMMVLVMRSPLMTLWMEGCLTRRGHVDHQ